MGTHLEEIKRKILPILQRYGVKRGGLFGSCVREEMSEDSDIDIWVEIEEMLGRKIDLVEYNTIKPLLRERILKERVIIL